MSTQEYITKEKGLARYYSHFKHRSTSFYNPVTCTLFSELSRVHSLPVGASLEDVLEACDTRVLYLLPDIASKYPTREMKYPDASHWHSIQGIRVDRFLDEKFSGRVTYKGKKIDFYPVETWFSVETGASMKEVIQGYEIVRKILEDNFQPASVHQGTHEPYRIELLATPSFMGSDLLKRSLPYGKDFPTLPEEELLLLLGNSVQGRVETFYHGQDRLEGLHDYDARWFYASCVRNVPNGPMIHDSVHEIAYTGPSRGGHVGMVIGFYKARVTVPSNWGHIGLLPSTEHTYPNKPDETFTTFCTSSELALALKHEWKVEVQERVLFPEAYKVDALRLWSERLQRVRNEVALQCHEPFRSMIRDSSRNILLHTVGSFNRYEREYDGYCLKEEIPHSATTIERVRGTKNLYKFTVLKPMNPLQKQLCKPEWALWVWGVARRKLAEKALEVPFTSLVALRTDAIWTTQAMSFTDTGKIGEFVEKPLRACKGLSWPKDNTDMLRVVKTTRGRE